MAEDLQHLIERIQKEAVDTGEEQAATIVSQAKTKAASLVKDAEQKAERIVDDARKESEAFTQRSIKTLEQAARDLLISVGQGVENILSDIVDKSLNEALSIDVLQQMLVKMCEAYFSKLGTESRVELLVSPEDQESLKQFFSAQYQEKMKHGVEIHADNDVFKGFKVGFEGDQVYHDFTKESIAEALTSFLRPHLAEIVHRAAQSEEKQDN